MRPAAPRRALALACLAASMVAAAADPAPEPQPTPECRLVAEETERAEAATAAAREQLRQVWRAVLPFVVVARYIEATQALTRAEQREREWRSAGRWMGCERPASDLPVVEAQGNGLRLRPTTLLPD